MLKIIWKTYGNYSRMICYVQWANKQFSKDVDQAAKAKTTTAERVNEMTVRRFTYKLIKIQREQSMQQRKLQKKKGLLTSL